MVRSVRRTAKSRSNLGNDRVAVMQNGLPYGISAGKCEWDQRVMVQDGAQRGTYKCHVLKPE